MAADQINASIGQLRIKHFHLLELLVEFGTARKVAEHLHVSQPAVSQMLKDLESAFGCDLFDRRKSGVSINQRAAALLRRTRPMLGELRAARSEMLAEVHAILRIGANLQLISNLLPAALESLRTDYPNLRFVIREGPTNTLLDALLDGELDCTIGRLPERARSATALANLQFLPLYGGELCLVVGHSHPLARRKRLELKDLAEAAWALGGASGQARKLLDQLFLSAGLQPPDPVLECRPHFANLTLVAKMKLVTIATYHDAYAAQQAGTIHILPIKLPVESAPIAFINRKASNNDIWLKRAREAISNAAERIR